MRVFPKQMRPKLIAAVTAACVVACAWVAAPALSLDPFQPPAVDFEQRLPALKRLGPGAAPSHEHEAGAAHGAHAGRDRGPGWVSTPIAAPHRFDFVGLEGEMRPLQLRVRERGEAWSEWVVIHSGDPLYAGGADEVQVRAYGYRPAGRLHYVNVSGDAGSAAASLLSAARRAINSAYVAVATATVSVAGAEPPQPKMVGRAAWGANGPGGCKPRGPAAYGRVRTAVVHHTVNANDYTKAEAPGLVLGICRYHRNANGWNDIGYQALVDRFGRLYEGRAGGIRKAPVGAHTQGFNDETTGVAVIGTYIGSKASIPVRRALIRYLAWKLALHGAVPATGKTRLVSDGGELSRYPAGAVVWPFRVHGHGRLGRTACPGSGLARQLKFIRAKVQRRIRNHPGTGGGSGGAGA